MKIPIPKNQLLEKDSQKKKEKEIREREKFIR